MATTMTIPICTPLAKDTRPTHLTLSILHKELNAFAMKQKSSRGGGLHGYLALVMPDAAYLALTNVAFVIPAYPGENPVHPPGANGPIITEINRAHLSNTTQFNTYREVENGLKEMILAAVPNTFIQVLDNHLFGYSQVSAIQLLTHLDTTYGKVTHRDLANNLEQMDKQWDPSTPLEDLWTQIRLAREYAATTSVITDTNAILSAEKNLSNSGVFSTAFDQWRIKPHDDKTYASLMEHFNDADINRLHAKTVSQAGYSAIKQPNDNKENSTGSIKGYHYCWSHGINPTHMSKNCRVPKEGHINNATITNTQGGCTFLFTPFHQGGRGGRGREARGRDGGRGRGRGPVVTPEPPALVPVIE
jgi:hypothetical protein